MNAWQAITAFGDSALLLPVMIWMGACQIAVAPYRRDGWRWAVAALGCGGIVMLSKLLFMGWGVAPAGVDYTGFSGHTALAILTWTSFGAVLSRGARPPLRYAAIGAGAVLGALVGVSRLVLKVHSEPEVWLGALTGGMAATGFVAGMAHALPARARASAWRLCLIGGTLVLCLLLYGRVFPSQHLLQDIALWLSGRPSVFTRGR